MATSHPWSVARGLKITPYMQDLMLYSGQEETYERGSEQLSKYLRVETDDSQLNRLCVHYGQELESQMKESEAELSQCAESFIAELGEGEVVYSMLDGCMLPTRPHQDQGEEIGSWKEMKLGRIFREQDHLNLGKRKKSAIRNSLYVSHFGKHDEFSEKFAAVVDVFESRDENLVFINDGATWIENWIQTHYPLATNILDFFHALEYLHEFAKVIYSTRTQSQQIKQWVEQQTQRLSQDQVKEVIQEIEQMELSGKTKLKAQQKILTYYQNNQHRMYYQTYRDRGLLIGSGPIESAHRFVLQKRMKLSGQKWTRKGAQAVANLRVIHLNQQWDRVIDLIIQSTKKAA